MKIAPKVTRKKYKKGKSIFESHALNDYQGTPFIRSIWVSSHLNVVTGADSSPPHPAPHSVLSVRKSALSLGEEEEGEGEGGVAEWMNI